MIIVIVFNYCLLIIKMSIELDKILQTHEWVEEETKIQRQETTVKKTSRLWPSKDDCKVLSGRTDEKDYQMSYTATFLRFEEGGIFFEMNFHHHEIFGEISSCKYLALPVSDGYELRLMQTNDRSCWSFFERGIVTSEDDDLRIEHRLFLRKI